jgi:hypothetical protein
MVDTAVPTAPPASPDPVALIESLAQGIEPILALTPAGPVSTIVITMLEALKPALEFAKDEFTPKPSIDAVSDPGLDRQLSDAVRNDT